MDIVEVTTERMAYGGSALARHEGRVIFIPYALPGERIRVRLQATKKRWVEGELIEILEASPDRIEGPCPHFGPHKCGGCQWQHARYEAQLRYKSEIVQEQLERIGKVDSPPVRPCLGMDVPWRYRNHVQLHNTPRGPGFVREDHAGIFSIDVCLIMNDAIYPLFEAVEGKVLPGVDRVILRGSERTGERLVLLEGETPPPALPLPLEASIVVRDRTGNIHPVKGVPAYHEQVAGRMWRVNADSFFQVNTEQADTLVRVVQEFVGSLEGTEVVLDAYAGAGLFGLSLAPGAARTYLVESHPAAAAAAREHSKSESKVTVIEGQTEEVLPAWEQHAPRPTIAVLDPPRAGCKPAVLDALGNMEVPTIIYVACDPATQARDIRYLLDRGYLLDVVQPVDLFPQTYHIESVARLSHLNGAL